MSEGCEGIASARSHFLLCPLFVALTRVSTLSQSGSANGSARREVRGHTDAVFSFLNVFGLELAQMFLFGSLVVAAIWLRNHPDHHKRLMLLATLCVLPNAVVRLFLRFFDTNLAFLSIWAMLIVVIVLIDSLRNRRLHPTFGIGATAALTLMYFAQFASRTQAWQVFASHLVR